MEKERLYFIRLFSFCYGRALEVVLYYTDSMILQNRPFDEYLNKNKHILYHKYAPNTQCCQCFGGMSLATGGGKVKISKSQLEAVFDLNGPLVHLHPQHNRRKNYCLCAVIPKTDISTEDLQIGELYSIIKEGHPQPSYKIKEDLKTIRNIRNELAHIINDGTLKEQLFEDKWKKLEEAVLDIAAGISPSYMKQEKKLITRLKNNDVKLEDIQDKLELVHKEIMQGITGYQISLQRAENQFNIMCSYQDEQTNQTVQHQALKKKVENLGISQNSNFRLVQKDNDLIKRNLATVKKSATSVNSVLQRIMHDQEGIKEKQSEIKQILDERFEFGSSNVHICGGNGILDDKTTNTEQHGETEHREKRTAEMIIDIEPEIDNEDIVNRLSSVKTMINTWDPRFKVKDIRLGSVVVQLEIDVSGFKDEDEIRCAIREFVYQVLDQANLQKIGREITVRIKNTVNHPELPRSSSPGTTENTPPQIPCCIPPSSMGRRKRKSTDGVTTTWPLMSCKLPRSSSPVTTDNIPLPITRFEPLVVRRNSRSTDGVKTTWPPMSCKLPRSSSPVTTDNIPLPITRLEPLVGRRKSRSTDGVRTTWPLMSCRSSPLIFTRPLYTCVNEIREGTSSDSNGHRRSKMGSLPLRVSRPYTFANEIRERISSDSNEHGRSFNRLEILAVSKHLPVESNTYFVILSPDCVIRGNSMSVTLIDLDSDNCLNFTSGINVIGNVIQFTLNAGNRHILTNQVKVSVKDLTTGQVSPFYEFSMSDNKGEECRTESSDVEPKIILNSPLSPLSTCSEDSGISDGRKRRRDNVSKIIWRKTRRLAITEESDSESGSDDDIP